MVRSADYLAESCVAKHVCLAVVDRVLLDHLDQRRLKRAAVPQTLRFQRRQRFNRTVRLLDFLQIQGEISLERVR